MDKLWISFWVCGYPQSYPQSYPQDILKNGFLWYHDALFEVGWFLVGVLMKNASLFDGIFEDELGVSDVPKDAPKVMNCHFWTQAMMPKSCGDCVW